MAIRNIPVSVLAKIKNQAIKEGISNQMGQQLFLQEEFLRKLSLSKYRDNMILKGGMFIYTLTDFESRPTKDIDFMMRRLSNECDNIKRIMEEICEIDTNNDYIQLKVIDTEKITLTNKYPGVKTKLQGQIGTVRVPFSIDIGIDDVIWPEPVIRKIKTRLKDFTEPEVLTYSVESTIAEKFDAILRLMEETSRMKDFYDIFYLSNIFGYNGIILYEAIKKTTNHRNRAINNDSMERIKAFKNNQKMLAMWDNYEPAKVSGLPFSQAIDRIEVFIGPIYAALLAEGSFTGHWMSEEKLWKKI